MNAPARVPGKYGRKPAHFPVGLRTLDRYAAGPLPAAPASVTVPSVAAWGMLGNDTYGDCGVAGIDHGFMAADADLLEPVLSEADQDVVNYYLTYTGGQDSGVVLSDFLAYVKQHGFLSGHTVAAYAPVAVHDVPTLQFAIDAYDFAYAGITVYQGMEQAFAAGLPWDLASVSGDVAGGHCVPVVGYDSSWLYCVTWGQVQKIAYPAWARIAEEAWAVITGEVATAGTDGHGINLTALQADLSKLANPTPPPVPTPTPPAPPSPEPGDLLARLARMIRKDITALINFLDEHNI